MWADTVQWGLFSAGSLHTGHNSGCSPRDGSKGTGDMCVLSTCWERRAAFRKTCMMAIPAMWVGVLTIASFHPWEQETGWRISDLSLTGQLPSRCGLPPQMLHADQLHSDRPALSESVQRKQVQTTPRVLITLSGPASAMTKAISARAGQHGCFHHCGSGRQASCYPVGRNCL